MVHSVGLLTVHRTVKSESIQINELQTKF